MTTPRVWFVVESGTDIRLVNGLAQGADVRILARRIPGGVAIRQALERAVPVTEYSAARGAFATVVPTRLLCETRPPNRVLVQNYGPAALAANLAAGATGTPTFMLVCSLTERYYRCRRTHPMPGRAFRVIELAGLKAFARLNAVLGRHYIVLGQHLASLVQSHGAPAWRRGHS